jgi:hypothetical protein
MINAARYYPNLRVVVACRTCDLDNDSRLKVLEKDAIAVAVRLKPLDWTTVAIRRTRDALLGGKSPARPDRTGADRTLADEERLPADRGPQVQLSR